MIKSIEQLNREFFSGYESREETITETSTDLNTPQVDFSPEAKPRELKHEEIAAQNTQARQVTPLWKDILVLVLKIALIALAFILLFTFLFGAERYQDPSMSPAIKDGDLVIFHRYSKVGYLTQDAVVLEYEGKRHVRRVVATAGDTVDITEEGLIINGALQQETAIYQNTERYENDMVFPLTVPEREIFVLGDARTDAADSRVYGTVEIDDTLGKVIAVIRSRGV